ncbi:hypothetical protein C8Q70DRAFT_938032 [Cubamyces menziesii]|nr:hypothetical protein C8Q70DRAFT_938032 [Cubamyces menziesii]
MESILFGAFAIAYALGVCLLLRFGRPGKPSMRDWVLYLVSTTMPYQHVHLSARLVLHEFVDHADTLRSSFNFWFGGDRISTAMFVAKFGIYVTQTLIGDVFMSYRLFVVWNCQKPILIIPAFLVAISIGSGYTCVARKNLLGTWATVFFVTSFVNNMFCSTLIMWRILSPTLWPLGQHRAPAASKRLTMAWKAMDAILNSAAVYSIASISLVITLRLSPHIGFPACLNVFPSLLGFVFSIITIRMAERSIAASTYALDAAGANGYQPGLRPPGMLPLTTLPPPTLLPPVRVHLSALDISIIHRHNNGYDSGGKSCRR